MPEDAISDNEEKNKSFSLEEMIAKGPILILSIFNWIESEYYYWSAIEGATHFANDNSFDFLTRYFDVLTKASNLNSEGQKTFGLELASEISKLSRKYSIPRHDGVASQEFKRSARNTDLLEVALYAYKAGALLQEKSYADIYSNKYLALIDNFERSNLEMIEKLNKISENVKNDLYISVKTCSDHIKKEFEDSQNDFNQLAEDHQAKLKNTSESITATIKSNAPYAYWTEKQRKHKNRSIIFGASASFLAVGLLSLISILLYAVYTRPSEMQILGKPVPDHFFLALALLSASTGIWALKILIKLMMTNISMEAEANERSTAIKTYVALVTSGMDKEVSNSFHKSLLSFGSVKIEDDTSPDIVKALELIIKKK